MFCISIWLISCCFNVCLICINPRERIQKGFEKFLNDPGTTLPLVFVFPIWSGAQNHIFRFIRPTVTRCMLMPSRLCRQHGAFMWLVVLRLVYVEHVSGVLVHSGCQAPCFGIELASCVPFHCGQDSVMLLWRNVVPVLDTSNGKLCLKWPFPPCDLLSCRVISKASPVSRL